MIARSVVAIMLPSFVVVVVAAVGLLQMVDCKPTEQPTRFCPRVTDGYAVAFPYNGTKLFVVATAEIEYAGRFADLDFRWTGPNAGRALDNIAVQRSRSDFSVSLFIWNATLADVGQYRLTVQLRSNSSSGCGRITGDASFMLIHPPTLQLDMDAALLSHDRSAATTVVWTKADGTDSPMLTVNSPKWTDRDASSSCSWFWPNADRVIADEDDKSTISEDRSRCSLIVANATVADLGTYWLTVERETDMVMVRTVVLKRAASESV